jgi:hypothetical protein
MSGKPIAGMGMLDLADEVRELREQVAALEGVAKAAEAHAEACCKCCADTRDIDCALDRLEETRP